jgi:hypothetical protein
MRPSSGIAGMLRVTTVVVVDHAEVVAAGFSTAALWDAVGRAISFVFLAA